MNYIHQLNEWSSTHNPRWLVTIRVALGLCLFIKGFSFIRNTSLLEGFISSTAFAANTSWLTTIIPWLHLLGGSLIIAGLFTRLAVLVQIPILLGAVLFVNAGKGIFSGESDLLFSVMVLVLLIFFAVEGGGRLSLDNYFYKGRKAD